MMEQSNEVCRPKESPILVSVVLPCLNEARTLAACIVRAQEGCHAAISNIGRSLEFEIVVSDNGSTDGSVEIAKRFRAKVVHANIRGYGAALRVGIAAARGEYVIMGDSDESYDFGEIPRFIEQLLSGYDLVLGNRFAGNIMRGAMPWHHRYIGNPLLSGIGRLLFRTRCRDWHCGLRGFRRASILSLNLKSNGMEFASEMIIRSEQRGLKTGEIPISLYPDNRGRTPHLRSLSDGWRHLTLMIQMRVRGHPWFQQRDVV